MLFRSSIYCVLIFVYFYQVTFVESFLCFDCVSYFKEDKRNAEEYLHQAQRDITDMQLSIIHPEHIHKLVKKFNEYLDAIWNSIVKMTSDATKDDEDKLRKLPRELENRLEDYCKDKIKISVDLMVSTAIRQIEQTRDVIRTAEAKLQSCGFLDWCFLNYDPNIIRNSLRESKRVVKHSKDTLDKLKWELEQCLSDAYLEYRIEADRLAKKIKEIGSATTTTTTTINPLIFDERLATRLVTERSLQQF